MNNFEFQHKILLWLLLLIPVFYAIFGYIRYKHRKNIRKLGSNSTVKQLMIENSNFRPWLKFTLLQLALALLIIGLAGPEFATETKVDASTNGEIIIALDISNSMLATDQSSSFSRLYLAKNAVLKLVKKLNTERIGMIVFAGQAVMQIPLTRDYETFNLMLKSIDPSYLTAQGTNIADAINLACESFSPDKNLSKNIIIISDGEDHEGEIDKAIEKAKAAGVRIYTVGIGSPSGAPVIVNGQTLKDKNGNIVISKLNDEILKKISNETKGEYINLLVNSNALNEIYKDITKTDNQGKVKIAKYDQKFHYFVFPALLLLFFEFFILWRENRWLAKINF